MLNDTKHTAARIALAGALTAALLVADVATLAPDAAQAAGTPDVTLTKDMPDTVLFGSEIPVTLTATGDNIGGTDGYNLSFNDVLPIGATFGSSDPAPTSILPQGDGTTVVVWENVADLLAGATVSLDYTFTVSDTEFDIGDDVINSAGAYAHTDPRTIPDFDPSTGLATGDFTGDDSATDSTELIPFQITKSEPSSEGELLRGVHDHKSVFTLTIDNNLLLASTDFTIVDYLPAGLEFLGCTAVDNSTPGTFEYTGAVPGADRRIDDTAHPVMTQCAEPTSVTTVTTDPDGAGPLPNDVYTEVVWNSAAIQAAIPQTFPIAATDSFFIEYAAAIPLRENVQATLADTTANLDNNTGALTTDEQQLENFASTTGTTDGISYDDDDTAIVTAEDLSLHKTVDNSTFVQGDAANWTLEIESSEYHVSTDSVITVTDVIPNGLAYATSNTALSAGPTNEADGTQTVQWEIPAYTAPNQTTIISLGTTALGTYRPPLGGPVASNDSWMNNATLTAEATLITDNDGSTTTNVALPDSSTAGQQARSVSILKEVAEPPAGTATCGDGSGLAWTPDVGFDYRPGDRVCWRLSVFFPLNLDTLSPMVQDFLPVGYTFESQQFGANHDLGTGVTYTSTGADEAAGVLTWDLADSDETGDTFEVIVGSIVDAGVSAGNADITTNLMKFSYTNTGGSLFQLRDEADARIIQEVLSLDKSAPTGPYDGTDTVPYTLTVFNDGFLPVQNLTLADVLPVGIDCSDVSNLGGSTCTDNVAPARDVLTWTGISVAAATEVPPTPPATDPTGQVDTPASSSVSYQVNLPDTFDPGQTLTNNAAVTDYETPTNTGTPNSIVGGPTDDETISITNGTLTKTRTTSVTESGNNAARDLAIGETVTYTVTAVVPEGTTTDGGVIADTMPTGIRLDSATPTLNGGAIPGAATFTSNAGGFTLTLPDPYLNTTGNDTFVIVVTATAEDIAGNTAGVNRNNNATFNWDAGSLSRSVQNRIVEPNLAIDKESDDVDDVVAPGQPVEYSIVVSNAGSVAHDLVVTDTVPVDVIPQSGGSAATNGQIVDGTGGNGTWNAGAREITWTIPSVGASDVTLTYDTVIANPITSSIQLTNSVVVTGTSIAGTDPDERTTYTASDDETVEAPGISVIDKRSDVTEATVGDLVTYDVDVLIPADVEAYDVTALDVLPTGMAFESFIGSSCTEPGPLACVPARSVTSLNSAGDTGTLGFFVGDVDPGSAEPQTITFTYTARVLDDAVNVTDGDDLDNSARGYFNLTDDIAGTPGSVPVPGDFDRETDPEVAEVDVVEPTLVIDKDVVGQSGDSDVRRAKPGDVLTFTVRVSNSGSSPAYDVTITDTPDTALESYVFTPQTGVVNTDAVATDGSLEWTVAGPIPDGGSITLTYTLTVPAGWTEANEVDPGPEATNTADVPQYFGQDNATRTNPANAAVAYREYGTGPYDVTPDTVEIEVDLASIGDRVWYDIDGDGVQDGGEPGLAGVDVTVTYLGPNGVPGGGDDEAVTVQTDANGNWLVEDLPGGAYTVDVDATDVPSGLVPSFDLDDGLTAPDGDWTGALGEDEAKRDVDTGFDGTGEIGDTIWFDQDLNGSQNGSEGGVPGIDVTLVWAGPDGILGGAGAADDITYTDTTDANGNYLFDDLPDGPYSITVDPSDLPLGMDFVSDPDAGAADGLSTTTLSFGTRSDLTQDFGIAGQGTIGDTIYLDRDGSGDQAVSGEPGLEGVTVTLVYAGPDGILGGAGAADDETYTDVTDANGNYLFENLPAADYSVTVTGPLPAGSTNTDDPDTVGVGDSTSLVTLGAGVADRDDLDQDFGYDVNSTIGDRVWWDLNSDGVQDAGEPGISGVGIEVTYLGPDGVAGGGDDLVFTTTTAADGSWSVTDIPDGNYVTRVTSGIPAGFGPTYDDDSPANGTNSAGDGTSAITLTTIDLDQDFGYAGDSSIGDTVWLDLNADGVLNGDEVGIADVTVNVTWGGPDGIVGGANAADDVVFTRVTADDGTYLVDGLPAGNYEVEVDESTLPNSGVGLSQTYDLVGGIGAPSNTTAVALPAATDLDTVDFGYRGDSSIGDTVFFDRDRDETQDTSATPSNEPGLEGVDVDVVWAGPDGVFGNADDATFSTTTDANGEYLVDFLPPGEYRVDVDTLTLPAGMTNTVDEDDDDDSSTPVTLGANDDHLTADFGYAGDASIGDTIFLDLDGNGSQNGTEPGVPGQTVQLTFEGPDGTLGNGDDLVFTTTTDANGNYLFENLPDGDYRVTVVGGITDDATNTGDPDGGTPNQSDLTITGGVDDLTQDFGYQGDNSLGDTIWWDRNRDGVQDPAALEPRLEAVEVDVTYAGVDGVLGTADDIVVSTYATNASGVYVATGLPNGDYRVDVDTSTVPAGMENTFDADDGVIGDGGTDPDSSSTVNLPGATDDRAQDFGYAGTGSIGDRVYFDRDGDGIQGAPLDEPGIVGAELTLTFAGTDGILGTGDDIVLVQDAIGDGDYDFDGLPPGDYSVAVTDGLPPGATNTDDPDLTGAAPDAGDSISTLTLGDGEDNDVQDFGYDVNAGLGDRVWWDFNRDGIQDTDEPGVEGVEITVTFLGDDGILGTADDEIFTDTTDANGIWGVSDIPEGDYRIEITNGVDAGFDNTFDPDTGTAGADGVASLLAHTGLNVAQDFGIAGNSSIGDTVWLDLDGDGTINGEEVGLEGVVVELTWLGPDGVAGGGDDQSFRTVTAADGTYLFPGLPAGEFTVTVDPDGDTLPDGLAPSFDRDGTTVSPDGTTPVTLPAATDIDDVDFGYRGTSSIGDTIFYDRDRDRTQNDAPGTDLDEPGLPGVGVTLTWAGEDGVLGTGDDETFTTVTGADGEYLFDGLPAGEYIVDVDGGTVPAGTTNTVDEDGDDNGSTPVTLGVDDDHLTADFGYAGLASIGDFIWLDLNGDGVQDAGEPGVPGQTVRLDGPTGTLTTTTGPDGSYSFDNLPDGDYTVTVVGGIVDSAINTADPDSAPGSGDSTSAVTLTGGVSNTDQDFGYTGTDVIGGGGTPNRLGDTIWFDVNADGVDDGAATEPRLTGVDVEVVWHGPDGVLGTADDVTIPVAPTDADGRWDVTGIPAGTYTVTPDLTDIPNGLSISVDPDDGAIADGNTPNGSSVVTLGDGEENLDQDFGYTGTGSIGDEVWLDLDGDGEFDPDEPGFEGATVTLTWFGPDGVAGGGDDVVYTTTVADDGTYLFENLPSGEFEVVVSGLPGGLTPTADPDGGDDSTSRVTLTTGETNVDQDFGYTGTAGVGDTVWFDLDDDGAQGSIEPGVSGVTVTVTSAGSDGVLGTADDLVVVTTTDENGNYGVTGLPAGPTQVAIDTTTLPSDAAPSTDPDGGDLAVSTTVLVDGETDDDQDFGVRGPGRIVGSVFDDRDGEGDPDPGEPGRPGVPVTITYTGPDGPIVITVPADENGEFDVPGLPSGPYTVEVLPADEPVGTISTGPTSIDLDVTPSDDPNNPPRADIPFVEPGSIGQRVFIDANRNGVQDPNEVGAPGVRVILRDSNGDIVAEATTDENGDFLFPNLPPDDYTVELDPTTFPPGLELNADPDGTLDGRFGIRIGPGDDIRTAVFGISEPRLPTTGAALVWLIRTATMLLLAGAFIMMMLWPTKRRQLAPWGPPTGPRIF